MAETMPSYTDYLLDVGGGQEDDEYGRLDISRSMNSEIDIQSAVHGTPYSVASGIISTQPTEARSFVNGLLSPFSPLLKDEDQRDDFLQFVSLQPCRKVSVVVRILPCTEQDQRCVFPHLRSEAQELIRTPRAPRDMVVVNPTAFGKFIPSQVTMETAKLVAQVANISSEDWARLYEFHHVMWPPSLHNDGNSNNNNNNSNSPDSQKTPNPLNQFSTMDSLSRAIAQDALADQQSALIISTGQASSCIGGDDALLPKIIACCQEFMDQKAVCSFSLVEVSEDRDILRDLLNTENKEVSIRHVDMKGAVVEGLTEAPLETISQIYDTLLAGKKSDSSIIATISVWENAVSQQVRRAPTSQITLVEMPPLSRTEKARAETAKETSFRSSRSSVSLGIALRELLLHDALESDPAVSYRDSTLTKVLQRSLESSKIVLLASVSQLSQDYESTLVTLNYLRRLLVKLGKTASSPFKTDSFEQKHDESNHNDTSALSAHLAEYADDKYLLEKLLTDPRQRLAKVMHMSPAKPEPRPYRIETAPSQEEYSPTDYMAGLDDEDRYTKPQGVSGLTEQDPPTYPTDEPMYAKEHDIIFYDEEKSPEGVQVYEETGRLQDLGSTDNQNGGISSRDETLNTPEPLNEPHMEEPHYEESYGQNRNSFQREDSIGRRSAESRSVATSTFSGMSSIGEPDLANSLASEHYRSEHESTQHSQLDPPHVLDSNPMTPSTPGMERMLPASYDEDFGRGPQNAHEDFEKRNSSAELSPSYQTQDVSINYGPEPNIVSTDYQQDISAQHENFIGEIQVLEGAVNQIQNMQSGLWESSAKSLQRLKESLLTQGQENSRLRENRDVLANNLNALQDEMKSTEAEYEGLIEGYEGEVQALQDRLDQVATNHQTLESSCASLKARNAELTEDVINLDEELHASKKIVASTSEEQSRTAKLLEEIQAENSKVKARMRELERSHDISEKGRKRSEQEKLDLEDQKIALEHEQAKSRVQIGDLGGRVEILQKRKLESDTTIERLGADGLKKDAELNELKSILNRMERSAMDSTSHNEYLESRAAADQANIQALEDEVRQTKNQYSSLKGDYENLRVRCQNIDVATEAKAEEIEERNKLIESLQGERKDLLRELEQMAVQRRRYEDRNLELSMSVQHHKTEKDLLSEEKTYLEAEREKLEKRVVEMESFKMNSERMKLMLAQKGQESNQLETEISRLQTKSAEDSNQLAILTQKLAEQANTFKREMESLKGLDQSAFANMKIELERLRENLDMKNSELEQARGQYASLRSQLFSAELKEEKLLGQLKSMERSLDDERDRIAHFEEVGKGERETLRSRLFSAELKEEKLILNARDTERALNDERHERLRLEEELRSLRDNHEQQLTNDEDRRQQNEEYARLQHEHSHTRHELREALAKLHSHTARKDELEARLDKTHRELVTTKDDSRALELKLRHVESDRRDRQEEMARLSLEVDMLRRDNEEREESLRNSFHRANEESARMRKENSRLENIILKTEMERDKAYDAIVQGRKRVSQIAKRGFDHTTNSPSALQTADNGLSLESRPELYVGLSSPSFKGAVHRSEQITSCIAVSAKLSLLESQKETSTLRSQVFKLEEEKEAEVAALKSRIKSLESRASRSHTEHRANDFKENWGYVSR